MEEERQVLRIYQFGDENFPVIRPLSELPHRVSLNEISDHDLTRKQRSLAAPDTAVFAELEKCYGPQESNTGLHLVCSLRGNRYLVIRNEVLDRRPGDMKRLEMLFPRARIAIKSGITDKSKGEGTRPVIYVTCAAAIEFVGLAREDEPPSSVPESDRPEYLFQQGEKRYSENQFVLAGLFFASAAAAAEASGDDAQAFIASSHYKHAQCMIKLDRCEEAIRSFDKVLSIDPHRWNAICFKGLLLSILQRHNEALNNMVAALSYSPSPEGSETLERNIPQVTELAHQQTTGDYHDIIRGFILTGFSPSEAPVCSDFISEAIGIGVVTGDGRGRGVFLTRDVKAGELLMVSNPLLVGDNLEELLLEAVRASGHSSRVRRLLSLLPDPDEDPPKNLEPLPGIQDFSGIEDRGNSPVIDVRKIKRVVQASVFPGRGSGGELVILAAAAGLINHSCLPNTSVVVVGNGFFFRAARAMKAGEEITIAYVNCLRPLAKRSESLMSGFGLRCSCRRCVVEKRFQAVLPGVSELADPVETIRKLEAVLEKLSGVSEEERDMIRVGYADRYVDVRCGRFGTEVEVMELMQALLPGEFRCILLVVRFVRRHALKLEWEESFERILDAAVAALIGDRMLPSEDYFTICEFLSAKGSDRIGSLFGGHQRRRF